jgi:hypothetical protein
VALVSGAVIVLLVALLQAMRDLMLRDPYAAPEFDGDSDPRRPGESFATGEHAIGECAIGEREPAIGGELRRAGERQARDFVR